MPFPIDLAPRVRALERLPDGSYLVLARRPDATRDFALFCEIRTTETFFTFRRVADPRQIRRQLAFVGRIPATRWWGSQRIREQSLR